MILSNWLDPIPANEPPRALPVLAVLLVISAVSLGGAPLFMSPTYSWVVHTTSESAGQGVPHAWIARLGFLAFGLGVCGLGVALKRVWARTVLWLHAAFGVLMIATAAFSHRPWERGAAFDPIEDALHSFTATAMGFAFSFGVLARLAQRSRARESGRFFDGVALVAATVIPLVMAARGGLDGLIQRMMFAVAYLWYAREALLLRRLGGEALETPVQPAPAGGGGRG